MNNRLGLKRVIFCFLSFTGAFFAMSVYIYYMSRFLDKVGPQNLPLVTIASSTIVMLYSILNSVFNRMKAAYVYVGLLLFLAGACFFLGQHSTGATEVFLLYLISLSCLAFFDISIVNLATSITTPLQSKLLLPYVSAFNSMGIILASFSISRLSHVYEAYSIPTLMTGFLLLLALVNLTLIKLFRKDFQATQSTQKAENTGNGGKPAAPANPLSILKETVRYIFKESQLFRTLAIVVIVLVAVQIKSEFKVKTTLALNYTGDELTSMLSLIYLLSSSGSFLMNIFVTKKLLFYFGVVNLLIFYPIWLLLTLGIAVLTGMGPWPTVVYFLSMAIPIYSFIPISISQVYSIAPRKYSNSIYFFIRGILWSLSTIFFSTLLLIYTNQIEYEKFLNTATLAVLLIIMVYGVYKLRMYYLSSLHNFLFRDDEYLRSRAIELFAEKMHKEQGELHLRSLLSMPGTSEDTKIKVMNSLAIIGNYQTIADLIQVLDSGSVKEKHGALTAINTIIKGKNKLNTYPVTKHLLLETFERLFISNIPLYLKLDIISSLKYFDLEDVILFLEKIFQMWMPPCENAIETLGSYNDRSVSFTGSPS